MPNQHPIENIMKTTMENIKDMIDVNTIVGDAVETSDGTVIIPISKVSFGFVAGGGDHANIQEGNTQTTSETPFAGGSGAGVTVSPMAFLVVAQNKIRLLSTNFNTPIDRVVDMIPKLFEETIGTASNNSATNINTLPN
ncbi:MAG: sporulation protein YtfJ [Clostridiales bacterium]|nr:sporulation protein YtfJ [Clostridiales bacterium]